jgi:hypothetical protein
MIQNYRNNSELEQTNGPNPWASEREREREKEIKWCLFFINLRWLNIRHVRAIDGRELKYMKAQWSFTIWRWNQVSCKSVNCFKFIRVGRGETSTHMMRSTELRGWAASTFVSYSVGYRFKSWHWNRQSQFSHDFPQSLQANAGTVPSTGPRPIPSTSFPIHYSLIILPFDAIYC